jgi:hypothetical protein
MERSSGTAFMPPDDALPSMETSTVVDITAVTPDAGFIRLDVVPSALVGASPRLNEAAVCG